MYRVKDVSIYLIKNRLKEWGIGLGLLFGIFALMGFFLLTMLSQGREIIWGFAIMFEISLIGLLTDFKEVLSKGITRETFAKSYLITSVVGVIISTAIVILLGFLPIKSGLGSMNILGVSLTEISFLHSLILKLMCILAWGGLISALAVPIYKFLKNRSPSIIFAIMGFYFGGLPFFVKYSNALSNVFNRLYPIGSSIPLLLLLGGVLSILFYYISYKQILKLEI